MGTVYYSHFLPLRPLNDTLISDARITVIIERLIDNHGQIIMETDVEVTIFGTQLGSADDAIIASYHA